MTEQTHPPTKVSPAEREIRRAYHDRLHRQYGRPLSDAEMLRLEGFIDGRLAGPVSDDDTNRKGESA